MCSIVRQDTPIVNTAFRLLFDRCRTFAFFLVLIVSPEQHLDIQVA